MWQLQRLLLDNKVGLVAGKLNTLDLVQGIIPEIGSGRESFMNVNALAVVPFCQSLGVGRGLLDLRQECWGADPARIRRFRTGERVDRLGFLSLVRRWGRDARMASILSRDRWQAGLGNCLRRWRHKGVHVNGRERLSLGAWRGPRIHHTEDADYGRPVPLPGPVA